MASSLEFVEYVCDQISGAGNITFKKMFGEYCIYCDQKVVGGIYDNLFLVKETKAGAAVLTDCEEVAPYRGAKLHYLVDNLENPELMAEFIQATFQELPAPRPKKKKE